ncbi:hypothetical protein PLESTM_000483100 [Pleodorina starrii]|nr:hypothetical protein PLESTM_000483100 [Pleodorina starrii]
MVSIPKARQQQQELDLQRLYILTQLHKATSQGKSANMQKLLLESRSLEPSTVHREVQAALQLQVAGVAQALHDILQQAGDPAPAAAAMTAAHQRLLRRRERNASGLSKLIAGLTGAASASAATASAAASATSTPPGAGPAAGPGPDSSGEKGAGCNGGGCGSGSGGGAPLSRAQLAAALQRRIGFRVELGPSSVPHPEAGTGLFIRGEARPGAVVAIFPGVMYGRTQLVHMPNFPKVDTDNPYLSCRYDQSIVDSKPWGRGDPGVGPSAAVTSATAATTGTSQFKTGASAAARGSPVTAASAGDGSSSDSNSSSSSSNNNNASSGSDESINSEGFSSSGSSSSSSSSGSGPWWTWAGPLASALGYLEGRHPLALGHFVNHPGADQSPNVLEASLDLPLDHPALDTAAAAAARPWLRAYLPTLQPPLHYDPYGKDGADEDEDDDDDEEEKEEEEERGDSAKTKTKGSNADARAMALGAGAAGAVTHGSVSRRRLPGELRSEELLSPPGGVVRLLVLVATRGLRDGEELLQNYRLNPHVARPDWYVVHDAEAEQRRWAKIQALDLGFKSRSAAGAGAAAGNGGGGGGGGAAGG